jgi:hypothetical protein
LDGCYFMLINGYVFDFMLINGSFSILIIYRCFIGFIFYLFFSCLGCFFVKFNGVGGYKDVICNDDLVNYLVI